MMLAFVMMFSTVFTGCILVGDSTGDNGGNTGNTGDNGDGGNDDGGNTGDGGNTDDGGDTGDDGSDVTPTYYSIVFNVNGGTGDAPIVTPKEAGDTFVIPVTNLTLRDYIFAGWDYKSTLYNPGDTFIMPDQNVTFYARWIEAPKPGHKITFNLDGGKGETTDLGSIEPNTVVTIPNDKVTKDYCSLVGWSYNNTIYNVGDNFVMPDSDVTFTAVWREENTRFTTGEYVYDRAGAGVMEIPFYAYDGEVGVIELNGALLDEKIWNYDYNKKVIVIDEDYMLNLENGEYVMKAYTGVNSSTCVLTATNSLAVTFDAVRTKSIDVYNNTTGCEFQVAYKGVAIKEIKHNGYAVSPSFYTKGTSTLTIKTSYIKKYVGRTTYVIYFENNDRFTFSIDSNVIFTTDYDYNTIHDTRKDNSGQNSLYQYYDNVFIVDAPSTASGNMVGRVLQFVPNVQEVTHSCHGIFTLSSVAGESALVCWYKAKFVTNKDYYISFDYLTSGLEGSGKLEFRQEGSAWCDNLKYGGSNNNVVHHYSRLVKGSEIGRGVILWGFFNGASSRGSIYIDNFSIIEVPQA